MSSLVQDGAVTECAKALAISKNSVEAFGRTIFGFLDSQRTDSENSECFNFYVRKAKKCDFGCLMNCLLDGWKRNVLGREYS